MDFWKLFSRKENLSLFFDSIPYLVGVYDTLGKPVYFNDTFVKTLNIANVDEFMKNYNVFDCSQNSQEITALLKKIFGGESATFDSLKTLTSGIAKYTSDEVPNNEFIRQIMTGAPVFDTDNNVAFVIIVSNVTVAYKGKTEVVRVLEYLTENWLNEFDMSKIEEIANLSSRQISRVFKEQMGETPFAYYQRIKISKIKKALDNPNLNVEQAFKSCGIEYNGMYARHFKSVVGMSPLEYKKSRT